MSRGGYRKNAGRKPEEFKRMCADLASSPKFFEWAQDVFDGKQVAPRVTKEGVTMTEAQVTERAYLWEKLAAYGYGKPTQALELGGPEGGPLQIVVQNYKGASA